MTTSNGLLRVDKSSGGTSHDVVARVRRLLGEQRVGHAGTLDPMATGLLIVAVGPSTRLLRFAQGETKRYEGRVVFGVATDSLDADGEVTERRPAPSLALEEVAAAAATFLGAQEQVPPMVSAIKVDGQRLHALARQGVEVERAARAITIDEFTLAPSERPDEWRFAVTCSVGTYVRVLLSDLAQRLGTVGHLSALRRTTSGHHHVESALTLDELAARVVADTFALEPPSAFVNSLARVRVTADEASRLRMGQRLEARQELDGEVAAFDEADHLVAVVRRREATWQPVVVMPPAHDPAGKLQS